MKKVFLESHHLDNLYFGFGQFNYHLISAMSHQLPDNMELILHASDPKKWKKEFEESFRIKKYRSWRRYKPFRINGKYDMWHSLNQNTKIEPATDIPYLLTVHNTSHIKNPSDYKGEKEHMRFQDKLNRADYITYISSFAKESTHKYFSVPDVPEQVIYNGNTIKPLSLPENFRPSFSVDKPFLFTIGEITARKNFRSLVDMMQNMDKLDLIIAGKNTTKEAGNIQKLIKEKGLEGRIKLPGKISEMEKQYCYKNCEAFVFPSLREGFGLPIIEALHFGAIVVCSHNTSLPEIGGDLADYWHSFDPIHMADTVKESIYKTTEELRVYKQKAKSRAASFSWDLAAREYFEIYQKML